MRYKRTVLQKTSEVTASGRKEGPGESKASIGLEKEGWSWHPGVIADHLVSCSEE